MRHVIVLGMHRSGTSAVSGALRFMGLSHGPESILMPPHPTQNPSGFWEQMPVVEANDALLRASGGAWDAPPDSDALHPQDGWARHLRELLVQSWAQVTRDGAVVVKDPRLCLTLHLWLRYAMAYDLAPVVINVWRHPREVAASLGTRDKISLDKALRLWLRYNRDMMRQTVNLLRIGVRYERFIRTPVPYLRGIHKFLTECGVAVSEEVDYKGAMEFINVNGRRQRMEELTELPAGELADDISRLVFDIGWTLADAERIDQIEEPL